MVEEHNVDLLVLIEHAEPRHNLSGLLGAVGDFVQISSHERFAVYGRFGPECMRRIEPPVPDNRMDFWRFKRNGHAEINVAVVHGLDIHNHPDRNDRLAFFSRVSDNILWVESRAGHKRTIVLGDLNANPFDPEITAATGLHAIRMRDVAGREARKVRGQSYEFFYNPMWRCFGGPPESPPGSYYLYRYRHNELFWHMIDQVVVRPDLLPMFPEEQLRILNSAGPVMLTTHGGRPDRRGASDHLPVFFRLNLES
jgi:hypothetical protein